MDRQRCMCVTDSVTGEQVTWCKAHNGWAYARSLEQGGGAVVLAEGEIRALLAQTRAMVDSAREMGDRVERILERARAT